MGNWFSNLHIRKNNNTTKSDIVDYFVNQMKDSGYCSVEKSDEADKQIVILTSDHSQWVSVLSDLFVHDDPESCAEIANPVSAALGTDVLGISCFDSDYLYLNLINANESLNGWVGIGCGKEVGINKRNNLASWKKKVRNYPAFSESAKKKYVCADEFLTAAESALEISIEQMSASLEYLQEVDIAKEAEYLYFKRESGDPLRSPHIQIAYLHHAVPCFAEKENKVHFLNMGKESCGFSVYFLGPYVEHDEITFSDVTIKRRQYPAIELELQKIQLGDGRWAYGYHDPEIMIPPGIPRRMKREKSSLLELERMYTISFVPHGNPRKMLDISVMIVPDEAPQNQAVWNVWEQYGSKEEFIRYHNRIWKKVRMFEEDPEQCLPYLKVEDFEE